MKPVSWQQTFVVTACFCAILLSHYAGTTNQAVLVSTAVGLLLWMREPPKGGPPPALVKAAAVAFILGVLASTATAHS